MVEGVCIELGGVVVELSEEVVVELSEEVVVELSADGELGDVCAKARALTAKVPSAMGSK